MTSFSLKIIIIREREEALEKILSIHITDEGLISRKLENSYVSPRKTDNPIEKWAKRLNRPIDSQKTNNI